MNAVRVGRVAGCVAVAALGIATLTSAQVATSFSGLQSSLHAGDRLTITHRAGMVTNGRLITVSDQTLRLMVRSVPPIDVSESSVAKIEHVTSRKRRGALLGFIGGALVGAVGVAMETPCTGFCFGPSRGQIIVPAAGIFGAIGAGIGTLVGEAWSDHRLIYLAP